MFGAIASKLFGGMVREGLLSKIHDLEEQKARLHKENKRLVYRVNEQADRISQYRREDEEQRLAFVAVKVQRDNARKTVKIRDEEIAQLHGIIAREKAKDIGAELAEDIEENPYG